MCTPCKNILTRLDQAEAQAPVTGEAGAVGGAGELEVRETKEIKTYLTVF